MIRQSQSIQHPWWIDGKYQEFEENENDSKLLTAKGFSSKADIFTKTDQLFTKILKNNQIHLENSVSAPFSGCSISAKHKIWMLKTMSL